MMGLKDDMPSFARHEGVWSGSYRHYNAAGTLIDEHQSRLICRFPEEGDDVGQDAVDYLQTAEFSWPDGRTDVRTFPAEFRDGRLWWDTELVRGWATELPIDDNGRSTVLYWQYRNDPDLYVYEMIQLSDCGKKRTRTWQWIRNGDIELRTAIDEKLVTRDWRSLDAKLKKAA